MRRGSGRFEGGAHELDMLLPNRRDDFIKAQMEGMSHDDITIGRLPDDARWAALIERTMDGIYTLAAR